MSTDVPRNALKINTKTMQKQPHQFMIKKDIYQHSYLENKNQSHTFCFPTTPKTHSQRNPHVWVARRDATT